MLFNVRSSYSLLQSTLALDSYVRRAKQLGYQALGLADHGVLHGALQFYQACIKEGIKPMLGLFVDLPGRLDKDQSYPVILYALTYQGYLTLIQISKEINNPFPIRSKLDQLIVNGQNHLVLITPGKQGELEVALAKEDLQLADQIYAAWAELLGHENIYLGLSIYPYNQLEASWLVKFAKRAQAPLVCNQLVHSLDSKDGLALRILQAVDNNEMLDDSIFSYRGAHYLYGAQDLAAMYQSKGLDQVLTNSQSLVDRINCQLLIDQALLPKFPVPNGLSASQYLKQLCQQALQSLNKNEDPVYLKRLDHELSTIDQMGFSDYFLVVWELIDFCYQSGIRTGPGRGSAAGSLVAFLLGITRLDPLEYDLLFERFLNPERFNMPDIDIDIPDNKRDQVLNYVEKRYGHSQVAQMITFGTFGAKQSLRDVLRVLGQARRVQDTWAQAIPKETSISLQEAYQKSQALRQIIAESDFNKEIYKAALTIEGLPRHSSTHASGVVIAQENLSQYIPVFDRPDQLQLTQFEMEDVEAIGLLKMDFLGLKNLNLLDAILKLVDQRLGETIDIDQVDRQDEQTLKLFRQAQTAGIFQFESEGIQQVLLRLQPESFEDLIAVNALYRPGPMQQIPHFIDRKHGKETIDYLHPSLEPILKKTYGIIVYQEQVMQICQVMAGFSLGQADLLRRAMGKKQVDLMKKQEADFMAGCQKQGIDQMTAQAVYQYIYQFANYGFNRAHAAVYSTLAYQLAYLKAHYPLEFYTCLLNQGRSIHSSLDDYIRSAKMQLGDFLPVDINRSQLDFSIEDQVIRIGLLSIQGLRQDFASAILAERHLAGPFMDFRNFLTRLPLKYIKEASVQALIDAGALDGFAYNRATLTENLPNLIQFREFSGNNLNLIKEIEPKIKQVKEWSASRKLDRQRQVLGNQLAGHPIDPYLKMVEADPSFTSLSQLSHKLNRQVNVLVYLEQVKEIETKNQEVMAFLTVTDGMIQVEAVSFPDSYQRFHSQLRPGQVKHIQGKVANNRRGQLQIVINKLLELPDLNLDSKQKAKLFLKMGRSQQNNSLVEAIKKLALDNPGPLAIIIVDDQRNAWQLSKDYHIAGSSRVVSELASLLGEENIYLA